jgi:thiol-disulfide isomerase/thioredoxin
MEKAIHFFKFSLLLFGLSSMAAFAQDTRVIGEQTIARELKQPASTAIDFTVVDTHGDTLNLYKTLGQGKTVLLDFFYTTCTFCITYSPVIEQAYQAHGSGSGDIVFWGLNYGNTNAQVDTYKVANSISNPCASGLEGNANLAISLYQGAFTFTGYPTYAIICPDKTVHWGVNYPPTPSGFDPYFNQCGATATDDPAPKAKQGISKMYPVPVTDHLNLELSMGQATPLLLEVYDLLGIKVAEKRFELMSKGSHVLKMNLAGLRPGTYFIKMIHNNNVLDVRKFSKAE